MCERRFGDYLPDAPQMRTMRPAAAPDAPSDGVTSVTVRRTRDSAEISQSRGGAGCTCRLQRPGVPHIGRAGKR